MRAQRRLWMIGGVVLGRGGHGRSGDRDLQRRWHERRNHAQESRRQHGQQAATTVNSLLAGIPQSAMRLGSPSAPVTVTEFGDLECPVCRDFALTGENR